MTDAKVKVERSTTQVVDHAALVGEIYARDAHVAKLVSEAYSRGAAEGRALLEVAIQMCKAAQAGNADLTTRVTDLLQGLSKNAAETAQVVLLNAQRDVRIKELDTSLAQYKSFEKLATEKAVPLLQRMLNNRDIPRCVRDVLSALMGEEFSDVQDRLKTACPKSWGETLELLST